MHKLAFSVGLILLIAFSLFNSLQILKIENVNAQVTVPKTYIQTVNDPYINSAYAWENFTTGLDPDSYALISNPRGTIPWQNMSLVSYTTNMNGGLSNVWTMLNRSTNSHYGLVVLGNGTIETHCLSPSHPLTCNPATQHNTTAMIYGNQIEHLEEFSYYLPVFTNTNPIYWIYNDTSPAFYGMEAVWGLGDLLKSSYGFTKLWIFGWGIGGSLLNQYLIDYPSQTTYEGVSLAFCHLAHGYHDSCNNGTGYYPCWDKDHRVDYHANYYHQIRPYHIDIDYQIIVPNSAIDPVLAMCGDMMFNALLDPVTGGCNNLVWYGWNGVDIWSGFEARTNWGTGVYNDTRFYDIYQTVWVDNYIGYANKTRDSYSTFTAYCKRVGADEWGDCIARQGYYPHLNSYCLDWNNKLIKPMTHFPYIPADIGNDQIILQATAKHSAPTWYGNWPPIWKSLWGPTIGGTIMLYFNVYVHDNVHGGDKWLFNFHESNPWAGPNMFVLEIFLSRWVVPMNYPGVPFQSVPPGYYAFEQFCTGTTHDNDLHMLTCPFDMPVSDQWYYFLYDVGNKLPDCAEKIEIWSMGADYIPAYDVLGFQLMTIAMGAETIGGSWTFQFGDISLTDMRWGTGSAYQNSAKCEIKTRADGVQNIPRLAGEIGYPNPLRPYMTYTNDSLDADIKEDTYLNFKDAILLDNRFGSLESDPDGSPTIPSWDYTCDIVKDGIVNYLDAIRLGAVFGQHPTTGTYQTGLGTIKVWMVEVDNYGGYYWPDPPPGYVGPPWTTLRTTPYTCNLYLEMWDVIDWPNYVSRTIAYNPCINYMGRMVFYNGTSLNQTGICLYAYDYPIHD